MSYISGSALCRFPYSHHAGARATKDAFEVRLQTDRFRAGKKIPGNDGCIVGVRMSLLEVLSIYLLELENI